MIRHSNPVLRDFLQGNLRIGEACRRLGVPRSTLWRVKKRLDAKGASAFMHGLKGRRSNNAKSEFVRRRVLELLDRDFDPGRTSLLRFYREHIVGRYLSISYSTVRKWWIGSRKDQSRWISNS